MIHDLFICHASEDKDDFVRPLAKALQAKHLSVWFDEFSLAIGDSLRTSIERGLSSATYGVVVLSPSFFGKGWPERELGALTAREISENRRLILPVWHGVSYREVADRSLLLADVLAADSSHGLDQVASEIERRIQGNESPLTVARREMGRFNFEYWNDTDEGWMRLAEFMGSDLRNPMDPLRWSFPLPHGGYAEGHQKGIDIAWGALQWDWILHEEEVSVTQITHPDRVHEFIEQHPALFEVAEEHPDLLLTYAPQLSIRRFSGPFASLFDRYLEESTQSWKKCDFTTPGSDADHAIEGKLPACDAELSLRAESFGNYKPKYVAHFYTQGERHRSHVYDDFQFIIWLLSEASSWLGTTNREYILAGLAGGVGWPSDLLRNVDDRSDELWAYLRGRRKKPQKPAREILARAITNALEKLQIESPVQPILDSFVERDLVGDHKKLIESFAQKRRRKRT